MEELCYDREPPRFSLKHIDSGEYKEYNYD